MKKINKTFVVVLGVVFAVSALFISASIDSGMETEKQAIVKSLITSANNDNGIAVVIDGRVDRRRLASAASMPYEELKSKIGAKNDFVVYFVDDEERPVPIGSKTCIGKPMELSDACVYCSIRNCI